MHIYQIDGMAKEILKVPHTKKDIVEALEKYWKGSISETWTVNDIITTAEKMDKKISEDVAQEILDEIEHRYDASMGISFGLIETYLEQYFEEQAEKG